MRSFICMRFHRRFVVRYFGGLRNLLLWVAGVSLMVYVVDSFLFGSYTDMSKIPFMDVEGPIVHKMFQNTDGASLSDQTKPASQSVMGVKVITEADGGQSKLGCAEVSECPVGEYSYYIQSGLETNGSPTICFNGQYAFSKQKNNGKRGINMLVVNSTSMIAEDVRSFDTYEDDAILLRYLRLGIEDGHIILLATQDDASGSLKEDSKQWLQAFGSRLISDLKFRDAFVMIGQRGLAIPGSAIEKLGSRQSSESFSRVIEIKGCAKFPLGDLKRANTLVRTVSGSKGAAEIISESSKVGIGETVNNCGLATPCGANSIAAHLFTGKDNVASPRMCINGAYVFDSNVNNPGRGLNVAVYDTTTSTVVQTKRFDTYEIKNDVTALINLLNGLKKNQLVFAVSHDDMFTAMTDEAKQALQLVGSSYSKQIAFRDAWIFVGRSEFNGGYSPIEEIEFGGPDVWPSPIDQKICVPINLPSSPKKPDVELKKNAPKRVFCRKYDGYEEFCKGSRLDEHLSPAPLLDSSMKDSPVFQIPIVVIPGLSHIATLQQFEALMAIPGIVPKLVTVMYDMKFEESGLLADFFSFSKVQLPSSTKYIHLIDKGLEEIWKTNSAAKYVIILEEEVIPAVDLLNYFAQCLTILEQDKALVGASAWNENGFDTVSTMPTLVYRGNTFPGLGLLLKKSFYDNFMMGKMLNCCLQRSWYGWFEAKKNGTVEVIIPDVSRVARRQFMGLTENVDYVRAYFGRVRKTTTGITQLENIDLLPIDKYNIHIDNLIAKGSPLEGAGACLDGRTSPGNIVPSGKGKTYVVYYEQDNAKDEEIIGQLNRCFGLFYAKGYPVKGLHEGVMRFTYMENHVLLVGSSTKYYSHKPGIYEPVKKPAKTVVV